MPRGADDTRREITKRNADGLPPARDFVLQSDAVDAEVVGDGKIERDFFDRCNFIVASRKIDFNHRRLIALRDDPVSQIELTRFPLQVQERDVVFIVLQHLEARAPDRIHLFDKRQTSPALEDKLRHFQLLVDEGLDLHHRAFHGRDVSAVGNLFGLEPQVFGIRVDKIDGHDLGREPRGNFEIIGALPPELHLIRNVVLDVRELMKMDLFDRSLAHHGGFPRVIALAPLDHDLLPFFVGLHQNHLMISAADPDVSGLDGKIQILRHEADRLRSSGRQPGYPKIMKNQDHHGRAQDESRSDEE